MADSRVPPAPQPQQPAAAMLDITIQGSYLTRSIVPPNVTVNGFPVMSAYGRRIVPIPAGRARVDVACWWLRTYGQASLEADVRPGETVPVFYSTPMLPWGAPGRIGHLPQKRAGLLGLIVLFLTLLAVVVFLPPLAIWIAGRV